MLKPAEKAYFQALTALKNKEYSAAAEQFDKAAPFFEKDKEFGILRETTHLLIATKTELKKLEQKESLSIEESFSNG
jgi:outer membrane protein assembly factor BamD (BamD/ComL family)